MQFQVGSNPNGTARESAIVINDQRAAVQQAAAACQLNVVASVDRFAAAGGAGTISISGPGGCSWTAASDVSWIALAPLSGAGSGSVSFTVAVNSGAARSGTVTVGAVAIAITQDASGGPAPPPATCTTTLQPTSTSMTAAGGTASVAITTASSCSWTASSLVPWITLTPPVSGTGNGSLGYSVAANTSTTGRVGSINIGGTTFTVNQAGSSGTSCTISINPTSQSVPAGGATGVTVVVSTASGCTWTATSNATWLTIAGGASGSGNGSVSIDVAANTGGARSGTVTIGGQTFTANQAAAPCSYSINPTSQSIGASGGAGTPVSVTTASGCAWTAVSNVAWLTITAGASGSGNGTVNFTVAANTGAARNGTMTIAGQTFTVNQAAAACSFSINPTSITVGSDGINGLSVAVSAPSGCAWTATSSVGWLDITSGSSGSGNGTVGYNVNGWGGGGASRTGTMTIAGQIFTVTQQRCSATISPQTQAVSALGGSFSVSVTIQLGCQWSAQESLSWVTITGGASGTGNGTVSYTVAPNTGGARSGSVTIASRTLTVNQAAVIP